MSGKSGKRDKEESGSSEGDESEEDGALTMLKLPLELNLHEVSWKSNVQLLLHFKILLLVQLS